MTNVEREFNLWFSAERAWPGSGAACVTIYQARQGRRDALSLIVLIKMAIQNPGPTRLEALVALRRAIPKATRGERLTRYTAALAAMDTLDALAKTDTP